MDFSKALERMKDGIKMRRQAWNNLAEGMELKDIAKLGLTPESILAEDWVDFYPYVYGERRIFEIEDGSAEKYWYSATSPEQAEEQHLNLQMNGTGVSREEIGRIYTTLVPPEEVLAVSDWGPVSEKKSQTAADWAKDNVGFIASTQG